MSRAVWKYPLPDVRTELYMPPGARPLCVQAQQDVVTLWAEVDPGVPATEYRVFLIVGTGHDAIEPVMNYVGTVQDGAYVWHVYEEAPR